MSIFLLETGVANSASVRASVARLDLEVRSVNAPGEILSAEALVLPGVGSFGAGMTALAERRLAEPLRRRLLEGKPTLAICLGMQLLGEGSEESPGISGLGIVPLRAATLRNAPRLPQMGWNQVKSVAANSLVPNGWAYFANSFGFIETPPGWEGAECTYGTTFQAAIWKDSILACQFHPELSGEYGALLLSRWRKRW